MSGKDDDVFLRIRHVTRKLRHQQKVFRFTSKAFRMIEGRFGRALEELDTPEESKKEAAVY